MTTSLRAMPAWIVLILAALLLAACGGSDDQTGASEQASEQAMTASESEPEPEAETDTGSDMMQESEPAEPMQSESDAMAQETEAAPATEAEASTAASGEVVTVGDDGIARVTIGGTDQMQYTVNEFSVEAGQEVELTFVHEGRLPVEQMGHNVVILPASEDYMAFGQSLVGGDASLENDYLPEGMRDGLIAYTDMIGGGETTTITFTAPDTPGEYPFLCTFPGHYPMMNGVMIVR